MKSRLAFITLLLISLCFGVNYFLDFLGRQSNIHIQAGVGFFGLISLAVGLQMAGHLLRARKSRLLLNSIRETKPGVLFKGLAVGNLFNSLLPLRLGEFIRAFYIGDALSISKTTVFISIIIERIVDGFILSLCFLLAGVLLNSAYPLAFWRMLQFGGAIFLVSCGLVWLIWLIRYENKWLLRIIYNGSSLFNEKLLNRTRLTAWSAICGTRLMLGDPAILWQYLCLSVLMWCLYFTSTALLALAFFRLLSPGRLWYVIQSTYVGVSSPVGPGYIGSFHVIVSKMLQVVNLSTANGFPILMWFIIVSPISLVGLFVLVKQRLGVKKNTPRRQALINKLHRDKDISTEFGNFLGAYFKGEQINHILTQAELNDKFKLIKSFKGGSNAHTVLAWQNGQIVVKKITLSQYASKLSAQADWLLEKASLPHLPKVISQERNKQYYSFDLAYEEDFFPFFDFIHNHSSRESFAVLNRVLNFMAKSIYQPAAVQNHSDDVCNYITHKVVGKVRDTANVSPAISKLIPYKRIHNNGTSYHNLLPIVARIQKNQAAMQDLATYAKSPIHGDLTVDNLIVSAEGDFMVIDPNNENQISTPVVDYGKIYQSLHSGYEFLIQLDDCKVKANHVNFEDAKSQRYGEIYQKLQAKLQRQLSPAEYKTIIFHEAVHYCRMLTYKAEINPRTVAVFYVTAVKLFNQFLEQYESY